jgi:hypothetical protein
MKKDIGEIKFIRSSIGLGQNYWPDFRMSEDDIYDEILTIVRDMSARQILHMNTVTFAAMNAFLLTRNGKSDARFISGGNSAVSKELLVNMNLNGQLCDFYEGRTPVYEDANPHVVAWLGLKPASTPSI